MKWAKNIKVLTRGTKVLIANLNNGKWVRTSNEAYALIKNMLSELSLIHISEPTRH